MPSDLSTIPHPFLDEINTWPWLEAISRTEGEVIDLGSVPARYWDELAERRRVVDGCLATQSCWHCHCAVQ